MFAMPERLTAAELGLALPIIICENGGLKQIRDDMDTRGNERVGVEGLNPDFVALAGHATATGRSRAAKGPSPTRSARHSPPSGRP